MMLHREFVALVALFGVAACSGPSGLSAFRAPQSVPQQRARSRTLQFKIFTAGQTPGFSEGANAIDIAPGRGGTMWFTNQSIKPGIGRIAYDGTFTEFNKGLSPNARPHAIIAGSGGNMWFSDQHGVTIGKVTPRGTILEYSAPQYSQNHALGIALGPNGDPWVLANGRRPLLAHLTPKGTVETEALPANTLLDPGGALTSDSHGNLWFIALTRELRGILVERRADSGEIIRIPVHMSAAYTTCCPNVAPKSIVIGSDGDPWFTTLYLIYNNSPKKFLGTLKAGRIELFPLATRGFPETVFPSGLAVSAGGLWITGSYTVADGGGLWRFYTQRNQTATDVPHNPWAVAVDANGNPWFTAAFPHRPSRIVEVLTK